MADDFASSFGYDFGSLLTASASFPPSATTTQTTVIPSYLYKEYDDDSDLQAFVTSYNSLAQQYINTINSLNLPIYTQLNGQLLDWVAQGLYGISRPVLTTGFITGIGPYNTTIYGNLAYNGGANTSNIQSVVVTDDIFKRIITWHFYKGDGKVFNIRWLKRRLMRFINGTNGTAPNVDNTQQISVTFGVGYQVNITFITYTVTLNLGGVYNAKQATYNQNQATYNYVTVNVFYVPPLNWTYLLEALNSGALELPFQFTYAISVG